MREIIGSGRSVVFWNCRCDCGKITAVKAGAITSGKTKSCGCLHSEVVRSQKTNLTHGCATHNNPLYRRWSSMITRCTNPNDKFYHVYGGKGVSICTEWRVSFPAFKSWSMANGFKPELQIDRIDFNGNYCPDNCRWVTAKVNANNTSRTVFLEYLGERISLSDLASRHGIERDVFYGRYRRKHSIEKIINDCSKLQIT